VNSPYIGNGNVDEAPTSQLDRAEAANDALIAELGDSGITQDVLAFADLTAWVCAIQDWIIKPFGPSALTVLGLAKEEHLAALLASMKTAVEDGKEHA
jgi:hypothetical protein